MNHENMPIIDKRTWFDFQDIEDAFKMRWEKLAHTIEEYGDFFEVGILQMVALCENHPDAMEKFSEHPEKWICSAPSVKHLTYTKNS